MHGYFRKLIVLMAFVLLAATCREALASTTRVSTGGVVSQKILGQGALEVPLVPWSAPGAGETKALAAAVAAYQHAPDRTDTVPLERFLGLHPHSAYAVALWLNIGLAHQHAGDYAAAITALDDSVAAAGPSGQLGYSPKEAVLDETLAHLLILQTGFGNAPQMAKLLADPRVTADGGVLTGPMLVARRSLWAMRHTPDETSLCGVLALADLLVAENPHAKGLAALAKARSTDGGLSLADLEKLSASAGTQLQAVRVAASAPIPVPSVMHWRLGHYVAIVGEHDGTYIVDDPSFGNDFVFSRAVLERNGSGFYLVPRRSAQPAGWRLALADETSNIRGGGETTAPDGTRTDDDTCDCGGVPVASLVTMLASIRIQDNPVGYHPPVGPDVEFTLTYNQLDSSFPSTPNFGNLGPQWTDNFLSFITDDPTTPGAKVTLALAGGGSRAYSYTGTFSGTFAPEEATGAILTEAQQSPVEYTRVLPDGSEDIYEASNGATSYPRLIFLSQHIDPQGNALTLSYDSSNRLTKITDVFGKVTTFNYNNANPLLLTGVTDPFGRTTTIGYGTGAAGSSTPTGELVSLTDAVGMTSSFLYNTASSLPNTFIASMTTPYGTSKFTANIGTQTNPLPYWSTITDPLGQTERDEFEQGLAYPAFSESNPPAMPSPTDEFDDFLNDRDAYFWDKTQYAAVTNKAALGTANYKVTDYQKATVFHFQHQEPAGTNTSGVIESVLYPLERNLANPGATSRVWYAHPNDPNGETAYTGSLDLPSQIARILPNGTTQLTQYSYNGEANVTSAIDPMGRETDYTYAANGIDVMAISQKASGSTGSVQIGQFENYVEHEPRTVVDASGNTTTYTYDGRGQVASVTNALSQETKFNYTFNYLMNITDANNVIAEKYTYDSVGRLKSETDSGGYALDFSYDNLDRLTKITYPDKTTTIYAYTNLDVTSVTDRLGRVTKLTYDADRDLTSVTDPYGRTTRFGYNPDGALTSVTDADGQKTQWTRDIEDRVTAKTYADGSAIQYTYDIAGRLISRTDALGQVTNYGYTTDNRVASVAYTNAVNPTASTTFNWDTVYPWIDTMVDGTGTTTFSHVLPGQNGALELSGEAGPEGAPAGYTLGYDALGRVNALTVDGAAQDSTTYDAIGRDMTDVTTLGTFTNTYVDETGQASTITVNGQSPAGLISFGYLPNSGDRRLKTITDSVDASANETITTDDADRVNARTDGTGKVESYTYNSADRLTQGNVTAPTAYTETYGYNGADFINSKSGETLPANNWAATNTGLVNQIGTLTPSSGTGRTYSYDADGNVLNDGLRTYTWDAENRLLSITETSTSHVTDFTYDGLGRRVAITEISGGTPTTTGYLWCGDTLCAAYQSSAITARYLTQGEVRYSGGTGTDYFYQRDHLGSVVATTGTTGAVNGTLATDAYGNTLSQTSTAPTFGYAGMFLHQPDTTVPAIYLTLNRAYDPYIGRWLSRDPTGEAGGIDLYGYVGNDPVKFVDLLGLGCSETPDSDDQDDTLDADVDAEVPVAAEGTVPFGFANAEEFNQFGTTLHGGLAQAGYGDAQGILQGSSVTGVSFRTGVPFDVGRVSDFDVALSGDSLFQAAQDAGIGLRSTGTRTGPLTELNLQQLNLFDLSTQLSTQYGRPVNFMIYNSTETALARAPSVIIPTP